jgi:hypothetical protein
MRDRWNRARAVAVVAVLVVTAAASLAQAAPPRKNERELRAREAYAAGRYH